MTEPTEIKKRSMLPIFARLFVVWLLTLAALFGLSVSKFAWDAKTLAGPVCVALMLLWIGGTLCAKFADPKWEIYEWISVGVLYGILLVCSYTGILYGYCTMTSGTN